MSILKIILSGFIILGLLGLIVSIFLILFEIIDPGYKHVKGWRLYIKNDRDRYEDLKIYIKFLLEFILIDIILYSIYYLIFKDTFSLNI